MKREKWVEQQRMLLGMYEMQETTFQPQLNNTRAYRDVPARINLKQPELYMAELEYKRQVQEEVRHHVQREREVSRQAHSDCVAGRAGCGCGETCTMRMP